MLTKLIAPFLAATLLAAPALSETPRIFGSLGTQMTVNSAEAQVRYIGPRVLWDLQPAVGLSHARNGSGYVGAGLAYTWRPEASAFFLRASALAGVHKRGNGRNLGGPIQFRTSLDAGVSTASGVEFGIGVDHRSSARIYRPNPGLNTVYLFSTIPLR